MTRIALLVLVVFLLSGCAAQQVHNRMGGLVPNPDPPERFDWKQDGAPEKPGTIYLDPYKKLKGAETWTAPEDGGVCLTPKAWRGLRHAVTEWPKWGDMVRGFIKDHNDAVRNSRRDEDSTWSRIFKWKF